MTREEAIGKWIYPAIATMWNENKCKEILEALEQEPILDKIRAEIINLTNGDMIKALFGRPAREGKTGILYKFKYRNGKPMFSTYFDIDWWNAKYKAESEESENE